MIYSFPSPHTAATEPNGLLAVGGDLSVPRLISAYEQGIFPWSEEGGPLLWWSPDPRAVIFLEDLHISRSLTKSLRKPQWSFSINQKFAQVIQACAGPRQGQAVETWITTDMQAAYMQLHEVGRAHSLEVYWEGQLVGGVYGVSANKVFCAESMFSYKTNASKVALVYLVRYLKSLDYQLIDCQIPNSHLMSLGCCLISRSHFLNILYTMN